MGDSRDVPACCSDVDGGGPLEEEKNKKNRFSSMIIKGVF